MASRPTHVFVPLAEEVILTVVGWGSFSVVGQYVQLPPFTAWVFPAQAALLVLTLALHILGVAIHPPPESTLHMRIATVYCCAMLTIVVSYSTLLGMTVGGAGLSAEPLVAGAYRSSQLEDWRHAVLGPTTWRMPADGGPAVADPGTPIAGTAVAGVVMGYASIMSLVSVYAAYSAAPPGAWTPLIFEPKGLLLSSGFVGILLVGALDTSYRACSQPVAGAVVFGVYALVVCLDRLLFDLVALPLSAASGGNPDAWWSWWQLGWYPLLAAAPPIYLLMGGTPAGPAWASVALSSCCVAVVLLLWASGTPYSGRLATLQPPGEGGAPEVGYGGGGGAPGGQEEPMKASAPSLRDMFMQARLASAAAQGGGGMAAGEGWGMARAKPHRC